MIRRASAYWIARSRKSGSRWRTSSKSAASSFGRSTTMLTWLWSEDAIISRDTLLKMGDFASCIKTDRRGLTAILTVHSVPRSEHRIDIRSLQAAGAGTQRRRHDKNICKMLYNHILCDCSTIVQNSVSHVDSAARPFHDRCNCRLIKARGTRRWRISPESVGGFLSATIFSKNTCCHRSVAGMPYGRVAGFAAARFPACTDGPVSLRTPPIVRPGERAAMLWFSRPLRA